MTLNPNSTSNSNSHGGDAVSLTRFGNILTIVRLDFVERLEEEWLNPTLTLIEMAKPHPDPNRNGWRLTSKTVVF